MRRERELHRAAPEGGPISSGHLQFSGFAPSTLQTSPPSVTTYAVV